MGLVDRAKNILITPKTEWQVIEGEEPDTGAIITGYALPLILLSAICTFIGWAFIGVGFGIKGVEWGIAQALVVLVGALVGIFVSAFVIDALAPSFASQKNFGRAVQLVVYSSTAQWVAGIFNIFPPLGMIAMIAGLYGIYLIYLGLPHTMKTPDDKRVVYMVVAFVVNIVLYFIVGAILTPILYGVFGLSLGVPGL